MKPGIYNFEIQQGVDFDRSILWETRAGSVDTPVDITGFTAKWQIKFGDTTILWSSQGASPVITLDDVNNKFVVAVPAAATTLLDFTRANHEFEVTSPAGKIYRLFTGYCELREELAE